MSIQRKKLRAAVGNSMNSTKYNTISNDTPSLTLPNLGRSQKDINPLEIEDFKSGNDKLIKNMQSSQGRMSKAVDGIVNVLNDSPDYSSITKMNKSPLALATLEVPQDKLVSKKVNEKTTVLAQNMADSIQLLPDGQTIETMGATISDQPKGSISVSKKT